MSPNGSPPAPWYWWCDACNLWAGVVHSHCADCGASNRRLAPRCRLCRGGLLIVARRPDGAKDWNEWSRHARWLERNGRR